MLMMWGHQTCASAWHTIANHHRNHLDDVRGVCWREFRWVDLRAWWLCGESGKPPTLPRAYPRANTIRGIE